MKCIKVLTIFCIVWIRHVSKGQQETNNLNRSQDEKQDIWVWGTSDDDVKKNNTTEKHKAANPPAGDVDNTCGVYDPPLPDFSAPGRRISAVKCLEYVWQIAKRHENKRRQAICENPKSTSGHKGATYVLGGYETFGGDFPNMGAIGWKAMIGSWVFMCGSSLISTNFVLTAAHCSSASARDTTITDTVPKIVRFGVRNILATQADGELPFDADIIQILIHPSYKSPKQYNDIALMKLKQAVQFNKLMQPACLWSNFEIFKYGQEANVAGWGVVKSGNNNMSPHLLAAHVDIIDSKKCDDLLRPSCNRNWCGVEDHQLCAGRLSGGVDACQGDSGGPLQVKIPLPITDEGSMHYILGVTSFGIGCGLPNMPGVYTRVSSFIDWIENVVWP